MNLSAQDVVRFRLAGQRLVGPGPGDPVAVVRHLGAVQSQDYAGAKWAIGLRLRGATDSSVEDVIDRGDIIRTHVLRPTWHLVLPEDLRWMQKLTSPRVRASMGAYHRSLGLGDKACLRAYDVMRRALEGGKALTRTEMGLALARGRVKCNRLQPLAHLMMRAELDAVVCSGPRRGKQSTYALVDERVPAAAERDRDEALRELAVTYFSTRGPASVQDFGWWSGLSAADARRATELLPVEFSAGTYNETKMWFLDRALPRLTPVAHLLPNYDEYFIGLRDRSAIGRRVRNVKFAATPDNPFFANLVFINGDLVGGWKRQSFRQGVRIKFTMVVRPTATELKLVNTAVVNFGNSWGNPSRCRKR